MNNNNAPFYVGQRVVCIESAHSPKNPEFGVVKDIVYKVLAVSLCGCGLWKIDVGIRTTKTRTKCRICEMISIGNEVWCRSFLFAPIDERTVSIPESLKEQAEEMIRVREVIEEPVKEMI